MASRKDFNIIAASLAAINPNRHDIDKHQDYSLWQANDIERVFWARVVHRLAYDLTDTNADFDKERFIAACNGEKK